MHEVHFKTIDSTNTYAKQHANSFAPDQITCITADEQTAGRGRFQNQWISPPGVNLYATFYFKLPSNTLHLSCLAELLALSFASLLEREGLQPKIKWPNDIQLSGKKLSGILCETAFQAKTVDIFLGIGVNVNMDQEALSHIDQAATSLQQETGKQWDRKTLLKDLQKQFINDLEIFQKKGFTPFHNLFEKFLAYKGETVRCFDGTHEWVGICHSITPDGQLTLLLPNQIFHTLLSGEIHLRKA